MKIADLFVDLKLDTSGFDTSVKRAIQDATKAKPVEVTVVPETKRFRGLLGRAVTAGTRGVTAKVDMTADTRRARREISGISRAREVKEAGEKAGHTFGTGFSKTAKDLLKIGVLLAGAQQTVDFLKDSVAEARDSQKVGAITENVIRSTGAAAKISATQVGDLATAISNKTGIDDEAIQSASNLLLTFTNLRNETGKGNDVFNQATQAATDLGAALGKAPKDAAIQLGKALNDPVKGITALTRVGVSFTDQQKEQIKTLVKSGDTVGAQKIILGELNKEFGGTAAAAATAGEKLKTTFNNAKEAVGTALLPLIDSAATSITTKLIPAFTEHVVPLIPIVVKGFKVLGSVLGSVGRIVSGVVGPMVKSLTGKNGVKGAVQGFVDFLSTHEEDMVQFFVMLGHAAIGFAKVGAAAVYGVLEGIRGLNRGVEAVLVGILGITRDVTKAVADAVRPFNASLADSLDGVSTKLNDMAAHAVVKADTVDTALKGTADGIKDKLLPALDDANGRLTEVGNAEVSKAKQRDDLAKLKLGFQELTTSVTTGSTKITTYKGAVKALSDTNSAQRAALDKVNEAFRQQYEDAVQSGKGQKALNGIQKSYQTQLQGVFEKMGLNKKQAKELADKYKAIPKNISSKAALDKKVAQTNAEILKGKYGNIPGKIMTEAEFEKKTGQKDAKAYRDYVNKMLKEIHNETVSVSVTTSASGVKRATVNGIKESGFKAATGGSVNGPGTATSDSVPAMLSNGEHVWTAKEVQKVGGQQAMYRMREAVRNGIMPAFARGGAVYQSARRAQSGEGIKDPQITVVSTSGNQVNFDVIQKSAHAVAGAIGSSIKSVLASAVKKAAAQAAAAATSGGGNGGYHGPVGRGAAGIRKLASSFHPSYIAGHRDPQGGPAFDIGSSGKKNTNIGNALRVNHSKLGLRYVIRQMQITSARNGWKGWRQYHPITGAGDFRHVNHVHVSYDNGGILPPGLTMAYNGTNKPETIRTHEQETRLHGNNTELLSELRKMNSLLQRQGGVRALAAGDLVIRETVDLDRYERERNFRERMALV